MRRLWVTGAALSAAATALLLSSMAVAGPRHDDVQYQKEKDGYGYVFPDDPLSTGVFGANDAILKIRSTIVRRTLIRPRTHFVPELLKSAESI